MAIDDAGLMRDLDDRRALEDDGARRREQLALLARLGARSGRADDLPAFLDEAVRAIGEAVGVTDEVHGALAMFSRAAQRFARSDVDFLEAAAHTPTTPIPPVKRTDCTSLLSVSFGCSWPCGSCAW
jgi:hypothetical protein